MRRLSLTLVLVAAFAAPALVQEKGGIDLFGDYDLVEGWLKEVEPGNFIHPIEVFAESADRVFITSVGVTPKATAPPDLGGFNRRNPGAKVAHTLYVVNRNGEVIEDWWKQWPDITSPHDVAINPYDPEKHVWVADRGSQQVLKFTNDGKRLVMALGEKGVAGDDEKHFSSPTDIAWLPDGTFFVSDGDASCGAERYQGDNRCVANRRVLKFDRNGKFLMKWDIVNPLDEVHGIAIDAKRRVYVLEREGGGAAVTAGRGGSGRILIFDENGKQLDTWGGFLSPTRIWITQDQFAWVSDGGANKFLKYDLNGKLLTYFGTPGRFPGGLGRPHGFAADTEGNLYVVQGNNMIVDKYTPKKNADRSRIVGPYFGMVRPGGATR